MSSEQAACTAPGVDPDWFYPDKGGSYGNARLVCNSCPIVTRCLDHALARMDHDRATDTLGSGLYGMWGGTTPEERKAIVGRYVHGLSA